MKLVTFGDSWPAGAELLPGEKTYGELLANKLQLDFNNYAKDGTSNEHMILQLKRYIEKNSITENDIAVFFVTSPARTLLINNEGTELEIYPFSDSNGIEKAYFKYFYTDKQAHFKLNQCILALQRMCHEHKINDFYIVGWSDVKFDFPGINLNKIYKQTCAELFNAPPAHEFNTAQNNKYIYPNNCHPNQQGHELISESLKTWILNTYKNII